MNTRILASNFFNSVAKLSYSKDKKAHISYITQSVNYLLSLENRQELHRPTINLLAQTLTDIDSNSVPMLLLLARAIATTQRQKKERNIAFIKLALKTVQKAIQLKPKQQESYKILADIYILHYQWEEAYKALLSAQRIGSDTHAADKQPLFNIKRVTGQLSEAMISTTKEQHLASPTDVNKAMKLALLYIEQQQFSKAIALTESLPISDQQWSKFGDIMGPIYIEMDNLEKGRKLTLVGYQALGVATQYIEILMRGIENRDARQQAVNLLTQASKRGHISTAILLQMCEQLNAEDAYFELAFELSNDFQYNVLTSKRFNSQNIQQHPKFAQLMNKIGLISYWNSYGTATYTQ